MLPPILVFHPHVEARPDVMGGSPFISGTKIPVRRLWAWHRKGVGVETLLKRYPSVGAARVLSALAFAYDNQELIPRIWRAKRRFSGTKPRPSQAR